MSTDAEETYEQTLAKREAVAAQYADTGVTLAGSRRSIDGYGPDYVITLRLYRCKVCAALVGDEDWLDARADHTAWHAGESR